MSLSAFFTNDPNELPLERAVSDGGFCGIFRTIACVGDSLSSGEFVSRVNGEPGWHDMYDYSWGQYLARMAGCKVYNFSRGGLHANAFINFYATEHDVWAPEKAAQAYIIALGVNDIVNQRQPYGDITDINDEDPAKNAPTFCGYYARIIACFKKIQPKAKFFLMTIPRSDEDPEKEALADGHAEVIHKLAKYYDNTYVLDFRKYAPVYDADFRHNFYLDDHMNAAGYLLTAKMVASYIDYIIRHNPDDFRQIGFVGTDLYNEKYTK